MSRYVYIHNKSDLALNSVGDAPGNYINLDYNSCNN